MNARYYSDLIIERSRDLLRLQDKADRSLIRDALRDICLDTAKTLATTAHDVIVQRWSTLQAGLCLRGLKSMWRAIIRNVKKWLPDHPIAERFLHVVMLAYFPSLQKQWPKIVTSDLGSSHQHYLMNSLPSDRQQRIKTVLSETF